MVQQGSTGAAGGFDWKWFLLSIEGRIPRSAYLLKFVVPYFVLFVVAMLLDGVLGFSSPDAYGGPITGLYGLAALWPSIATGVKRLHDRNQSGWLYLILLIPIVNFFFWLINMVIMKGTTGANRFGPDPLGGAS